MPTVVRACLSAKRATMQGSKRGQVAQLTVAHPLCPVQPVKIVDHVAVDAILWLKRKSKLAPPEQAGVKPGSNIRSKPALGDVDQDTAATGNAAAACNAQYCKNHETHHIGAGGKQIWRVNARGRAFQRARIQHRFAQRRPNARPDCFADDHCHTRGRRHC